MTTFLIDGLEIKDFQGEEKIPLKSGCVIKRLSCGKRTNSGAELEITGIDDREELIFLASRIVTSFRLAHEGGIGYNQECVKKGLFKKGPSYIEEYGLPYRPPKGKKKTYKIKRDELNEIIEIVEKLEDIRERELEQEVSILRLALSRFNRSYDEANKEDILIDLIICFEILFIKIKERRKRDRIKKRIYPFLKDRNLLKSGETKKNITENIERAYKTRNNVVHEGKRFDKAMERYKRTFPTPNDRWNFLLKIRDYARRVLLGYINELSENRRRRAAKIKQSLQLANP